jgi:hypothetical protein
LDGLALGWATERGSGCIVPPVLIKDRSLHGPWSNHRFIVPNIYLLMGAGRLVSLLSWVPAHFGLAF